MIVKLVFSVLPINIICLLIKAEKLTEILSSWKLLSHFFLQEYKELVSLIPWHWLTQHDWNNNFVAWHGHSQYVYNPFYSKQTKAWPEVLPHCSEQWCACDKRMAYKCQLGNEMASAACRKNIVTLMSICICR